MAQWELWHLEPAEGRDCGKYLCVRGRGAQVNSWSESRSARMPELFIRLESRRE